MVASGILPLAGGARVGVCFPVGHISGIPSISPLATGKVAKIRQGRAATLMLNTSDEKQDNIK
jgi:hypothetical protein